VSVGKRGPPEDGAWHGHRPRPSELDGGDRIGERRRRARRVERGQQSLAPDERERVASDSGRHRLRHAEHGGGGEGRVGRAAATPERA